jgi:hypothetical protein
MIAFAQADPAAAAAIHRPAQGRPSASLQRLPVENDASLEPCYSRKGGTLPRIQKWPEKYPAVFVTIKSQVARKNYFQSTLAIS